MRLLESEKVLQLKYSECTQFLEEHGIDTSTWGRGDSKPLMALTQELLSGEAELDVRTDNGRTEVVRSISIVTANVFFEAAKNSTFRLTEEYQEFSDGTVRQRTEIPESISEKMKIDESPDTAVLHAYRKNSVSLLRYRKRALLIHKNLKDHPVVIQAYVTACANSLLMSI